MVGLVLPVASMKNCRSDLLFSLWAGSFPVCSLTSDCGYWSRAAAVLCLLGGEASCRVWLSECRLLRYYEGEEGQLLRLAGLICVRT